MMALRFAPKFFLRMHMAEAEYLRMTGKALSAGVLDVGIGTVAASGGFSMPLAIGGLVFDRFGPPRHALFRGGAPGGRQSCRMSGERFGKYAIDRVSPSAIMLNDFIGDVGHLKTRRLIAKTCDGTG
jgi:hypothetical protein